MKIPNPKEVRDFYIEYYSKEIARCKKWMLENEPLKETMAYQATLLGMYWYEICRDFWDSFKRAS